MISKRNNIIAYIKLRNQKSIGEITSSIIGTKSREAKDYLNPDSINTRLHQSKILKIERSNMSYIRGKNPVLYYPLL